MNLILNPSTNVGHTAVWDFSTRLAWLVCHAACSEDSVLSSVCEGQRFAMQGAILSSLGIPEKKEWFVSASVNLWRSGETNRSEPRRTGPQRERELRTEIKPEKERGLCKPFSKTTMHSSFQAPYDHMACFNLTRWYFSLWWIVNVVATLPLVIRVSF